MSFVSFLVFICTSGFQKNNKVHPQKDEPPYVPISYYEAKADYKVCERESFLLKR